MWQLGMGPPLVLQFAGRHPPGGLVQLIKGEELIVIAHQEHYISTIQEKFENLTRMRPDTNGITCVDNQLATSTIQRRESSLGGRQVRMRVGDDANAHAHRLQV